MPTTTLDDARLRVAHVIAPVAAGGSLTADVRRALAFARERAVRLTLIYCAEPSLQQLDSAMRRLAILVGSRDSADLHVRVVVRHGKVEDAVRDATQHDPGYVFAGSFEQLDSLFDCVA